MLWESGVDSGDDTSGIDAIWAGKPRRRISHVHGEGNAWIWGFGDFGCVSGYRNPSEPIDKRMNACGSIFVTCSSPLSCW